MSQREQSKPDMEWVFDKNVVTFRDFIERVIYYVGRIEEERWAAHENKHQLISLALDKQEQVRALRDMAQNEWRDSMRDLTAQFATQSEMKADRALHASERAALDKRISDLETANIRATALTEERARASARNQWLTGVVITVLNITITVALAIAIHFLGK